MLHNAVSPGKMQADLYAPRGCARTRQCKRGPRGRDRQRLGRVRAIVAEHPDEHLRMQQKLYINCCASQIAPGVAQHMPQAAAPNTMRGVPPSRIYMWQIRL